MSYIKSIIMLIAVSCFAIGCGSNIHVVKTHQKPGSKAYDIERPWQNAYISGLKHFKKKEYQAAMELYAVALKQAGDDDDTRAWMYYSIARCYEGLKEFGKAEQNYIMAQNLDPNLSEASDGLARIGKRRAESD